MAAAGDTPPPAASCRNRTRSSEAPAANSETPAYANGDRTVPSTAAPPPRGGIGQPGVHGRIQRRRMQPEPAGLGGRILRQRHLGETSSPRRQAARSPRTPARHRRRPRPALVQAVPCPPAQAPAAADTANSPPSRHRTARPESAARWHAAATTARVPGPGVHVHRPGRRTHRARPPPTLQLDPPSTGRRQRALQGRLLDPAAPGGVPGRDGRSTKAVPAAAPGHHVIGQPRLRPRRYQPVQQVSLAPAGPPPRKQRCPPPAPAPPPPLPGNGESRGQCALLLERVGRQVRPPPGGRRRGHQPSCRARQPWPRGRNQAGPPSPRRRVPSPTAPTRPPAVGACLQVSVIAVVDAVEEDLDERPRCRSQPGPGPRIKLPPGAQALRPVTASASRPYQPLTVGAGPSGSTRRRASRQVGTSASMPATWAECEA